MWSLSIEYVIQRIYELVCVCVGVWTLYINISKQYTRKGAMAGPLSGRSYIPNVVRLVDFPHTHTSGYIVDT